MSQAIPFYKMQASGNDFVVIDNRKNIIRDPYRFTQKVCAPHVGVGADGVLLFENSKRASFRMRILNSDGSEAEACGNGFRCIARFAKEIFHYPSEFRFESYSGMIQTRIRGNLIRVQLVVPSQIRLHDEIQVLGHRLHYSFINTGVPHTVIFVEGLAKIEVETLGRAIRQHKVFKPKGTNVNFVEVKNRNEIHVRTYERGVERETLACGTGSSGSAVVSSLLQYACPPVKVKTGGGEILTIDFKKKGNKIVDVTLEGEAHFVYEGKLYSGKEN
ncbi:MAG TPA: diaminopimelate epimerase [bacterium]|nr:diaminopimelate epimerase [bacterium]